MYTYRDVLIYTCVFIYRETNLANDVYTYKHTLIYESSGGGTWNNRGASAPNSF